MKYSIVGTVHHVKETETFGSFQKREFILDDGNQKYPQYIPFELHKADADNPPSVGQKVEVEFYVQGREWKGKDKWFPSLKCAGWKADGAAPVPRGKPTAQPSANPPEKLDDNGDSQMPV